MVNEPQTELELRALRHCVNRGTPTTHGSPPRQNYLGLSQRYDHADDHERKCKMTESSFLSVLYRPYLVAVTFSSPCVLLMIS